MKPSSGKENTENGGKVLRSVRNGGPGNPADANDKREVLLLGVKGSGKTVLLSVLGKRFEREGPLGLCLVPETGTATDDFVTEIALRLAEGRFPAATGRSERMLLKWTVRSGSRTLFGLSSMDCAGETILEAFCGAPDGDDEDVSPFDDDELYVTRPGGGEKAVAETLREMADRAAAICLVLNPNDFPSNARRAVLDDPGQKRDFEERFKAMRRLSLAVAQNPRFAGKTLFVLLTQVGDEAIRSGLESTGDPASYVEAEFPALLRSAPGARCLAVSAVNEVDESVDARTGRLVLSPAHGFTSSGLAEFLVRVGGVLSPALGGVSAAWDALRTAERADSFARASVRTSVPERLAAAEGRLAAARTLEAQCRAFLAADPSRPDPGGRTEEEIEPVVAAAVRRAEAEKVLDSWVRRHAVAKVSGTEESGVASPDFWRSAFAEILDEANEAAVSAGGPDAAFSSSRFWGVADPEWLRGETESAVRRLLEDVGALSAAIDARDAARAGGLAAVCAGRWSGAPGLDDLLARFGALETELRAEEESAARAARAAAAKKAARARCRKAAVRFLSASAACAALAFAWHYARGRVVADASRAWEEATGEAGAGRFSDAVALAESIEDVPVLLFERSSVVDVEELARWRGVPADYAARVAEAVEARDGVVESENELKLKSEFAAADLNTETVQAFERAVAAVRAAMPGPELVNEFYVPRPGTDLAEISSALSNVVAKAREASGLLPDARKSATRRRDERKAEEDAVRRDAANAFQKLQARVDAFKEEFSDEDRTGPDAKRLDDFLESISDRFGEAVGSGSVDLYRRVAGDVTNAGPLEKAAADEAALARKLRLEAEDKAREAAIAARTAFENRRDKWRTDFADSDRSGEKSAGAEAAYTNAVQAVEDAESAESGRKKAFDDAARAFDHASRRLDDAEVESRRLREKRLDEERRAEKAREELVAAVSHAVANGEVPSIPFDVPPDDKSSALEAWREALLASPAVPKDAPKDEAALSAAFRTLNPYFDAVGVTADDESSSDSLVLRARAWADDAAKNAAEASRKCISEKRAKEDYGWKSALECENLDALVRGNPCASLAARSKSADAVAQLPAFFVVGATSGGRPVALPEAVKTPSNNVKTVDPATGVDVAVTRFDGQQTPVLRFKRHLGGLPVPDVPRLEPGTNRFTVEFGEE